MKKILITGAKGFVGAAVLQLLKSKGYDVIETHGTVTHNLCDWEFVKDLPKADVIIHLAGKSFVPDSFTNPLSFYNNNIISTLNILEKAKKDGAKVIFFSTYVYGSPEYLPIDEEHKMNPKNPYTQSKIIGEELCEAYHRDFNVPVTIFRPFNIYGAGQGLSFFIPTIISQLNNKEIHLNDSRPKRDFIYIDDVVAAVEKSIHIHENSFNIYNLGTGVSTSVKDVLDMLVKLSNSKARVIFSEIVRKGEVLDTIADITKIKKELNWHPKVTIEEGLKLCINTKC